MPDPASAVDRQDALRFAREAALVYGPWRSWKQLYKQTEASVGDAAVETDEALLGALAGRLDAAAFPSVAPGGGTTRTPAILAGAFSNATIDGDRAYLLEANNRFHIVDISDPAVPRVIGRYQPEDDPRAGYALSLAVAGTRVVLMGPGGKMRVVDVADAAQPQKVGDYVVTNGQSAKVAGDVALVLCYDGLRAVRLPQGRDGSIEQLGFLDLNYPTAMDVAGNLAYITGYGYGGPSFYVVDITQPTTLRTLGSLRYQYPSGVTHADGRVFVMTHNKLVALDVSRPSQPREVGSINISAGRLMAAGGDQLFVIETKYGHGYTRPQAELQAIDISRPGSMRRMGSLALPLVQYAHIAYVNGAVLMLANDGLRVVDVTDPARLQPIGQKPAAKTFGYMKRRARRLLCVLSEADPEHYVELACATLIESGQGRDALDLDAQWVAADIVYGGGGRYVQERHGRGGYRLREAGFVRRRRQERLPEAWDRRLDLARQLWEHPHLPWQTQEMAFKILCANGAEVSEPLSAQWGRLANGHSPAMIAVATRRLAALAEQDVLGLDAATVAAAVYGANPARRRALLQRIEVATGEAANVTDAVKAWRAAFATRLAAIIGLNSKPRPDRREPAPVGLTRRQRTAALLLAARFDLSDPRFSGDGLLPALPVLLGSGEAPLRELGFGACRRMGVAVAADALSVIQALPKSSRDHALASLCDGVENEAFDAATIWNLVRSCDAWRRAAAWELIGASDTPAAVLRETWTRLWVGLTFVYAGGEYGHYDRQLGRYVRNGSYGASAALDTALNSNAALYTLVRSGLDYKTLRLRGVFAEPLLPPAIFVGLSLILPPERTVALIAGTDDARWEGWRAAWLRFADYETSQLAPFWAAVQAALNPPPGQPHPPFDTNVLRRRVLQDAAMAATFLRVSEHLSPSLLVDILAGVSDEVWRTWREPLLESLRGDTTQLAAFWRAVRGSAAVLDDGPLAQRLLADAEIVATFGALEEDVLDTDNPAFAPLLLTWLQARAMQLTRDNPLLLQAATHALPEVRDWGLARLQEQGLDLITALRLMESSLPPSVAVARHFFEAVTPGGEHELDYALALCDSPRQEVRLYGREYVRGRLDTLLPAGILDRLSANPNPEMQAFLAEHLLQQPAAADTAAFDRSVLRTRGCGRRAKELVKRRLHDTPATAPDDPRTLLELARGRTPRDSEWALEQLARRAAAGETVEGVVVEGVAV